MSEFEIHQLMTGSRYEFDLGTGAYILLAIAVMAVAIRDGPRWSAATAWWIGSFYASCSALIAIRVFASIVRFAKQNELLMTLNPQFVVDNAGIQIPTLVLRALVFAIAPLATIHLLRQRTLR